MKLLLIDSNVIDIQIVIMSCLSDVKYVIFDYNTDTLLSLKNKISSLDIHNFTNIGIFQSNESNSGYKLINSFKNGILEMGSLLDPSFDSWDDFKLLLEYFKNTYKISYLDMMQCNIYNNDDWKRVINYLSNACQININTSDGLTGTPNSFDPTANWILEYTNSQKINTNLIGLYFSNEIENYKYILGGGGPNSNQTIHSFALPTPYITTSTPSYQLNTYSYDSTTNTTLSDIPVTFSSTSSLVSINSSNIISFLSSGTASITANAQSLPSNVTGKTYNSSTLTQNITIYKNEDISLNLPIPTIVHLSDGSFNLSACSIPNDTANNVTFTSSDPTCISISIPIRDTSNNSISKATILKRGNITITGSMLANNSTMYAPSSNIIQNVQIIGFSQTIVFSPISSGLKYGDPPVTLIASAGGGAVTYNSSDPTIISIVGTTATINKEGTVTITASQTGNDTYEPAPNVTQIVTIATSSSGVPPLISSNPISPSCFPEKTPIHCDQGNIDIDKINPKIHTINKKKILAVTKSIYNTKTIVCIEKDALYKNVPSKNTLVTYEHKVFYNGMMINAGELIGLNDKIYLKKNKYQVVYNVLLEKYSKMIVNNLIVDTLHPNTKLAKLYERHNYELDTEYEEMLYKTSKLYYSTNKTL
uniref:Hedgehog/Intein (Hint) domain-containing protein n=1 Tax=viral metagenome TaxID=1070528 RepID=A0A6C0EQI8_9ZZZZ